MLGWEKKQPALERKASRSGVPVTSAAAFLRAQEDLIDAPTLYEAQALRYSRSDLVYMCVNRIAEMCAVQIPKLKLFNPNGDRDPVTNIPEEEIEDHPFLDVIWKQPNVWTSTFDFVEQWAILMQLSGNVYWHVDDGLPVQFDTRGEATVSLEGEPNSLWMIRPDFIKPVADKETYIKHYLYENAGRKIRFASNSIEHFKRFHPKKELEGMSPLEAANYASATDIAAQKSNWALFKNGLKLSGIVESPRDEIDIDQKNLMEKEFNKKYIGDPDKAHQLMFLWSDFKYKDMGMSLRDAEFIDGSKLNRMRIFGTFGVHPAIILSEDVNRANATVGEYVTLKYTVDPLLKRMTSNLQSVLDNWEIPAEAHFVGVVPKDAELETKVQTQQAKTVETLVRALGPEQGVLEAQRIGVLSDEVDPNKAVQPASPRGIFGGGDPVGGDGQDYP